MFKKARIKLTVWYLLIIMSISTCFSLTIHKFLSREVERFERMQRNRIIQKMFTPPPLRSPDIKVDIELLKETKMRITTTLILLNGTILILAGTLGYFLAGKTLKPIQEMVDEQNRFISDASHELKTPLTSLKTAMEVNLRDKNLTLNNAKALMRESLIEIDRLQSLSEELLKLAQYEKPNGNLKFSTVNLAVIIKEAINKIKPLADIKEIEIINKGKRIEVQGNKYGLIDLIVILLDNAVKYSPQKNKVVIAVEKSETAVAVSIKDNGVGISKHDIPHIFDRFYRSDSTRSKSKTEGYGLGLSIAKKIADIHSAKILVESRLNKGTKFTIKFPAKIIFS